MLLCPSLRAPPQPAPGTGHGRRPRGCSEAGEPPRRRGWELGVPCQRLSGGAPGKPGRFPGGGDRGDRARGPRPAPPRASPGRAPRPPPREGRRQPPASFQPLSSLQPPSSPSLRPASRRRPGSEPPGGSGELEERGGGAGRGRDALALQEAQQREVQPLGAEKEVSDPLPPSPAPPPACRYRAAGPGGCGEPRLGSRAPGRRGWCPPRGGGCCPPLAISFLGTGIGCAGHGKEQGWTCPSEGRS